MRTFLSIGMGGGLALLLFLVPETVSAQLVTCQGIECNACHFVQMVNRIIQWIIMMFAIVAGILLAVAGVRLITSGGDQSALEKAKSMFTNLVIGLVIVLASWMIINVIMQMLTGQGLKFWGTITNCGGMVRPIESDPDVGAPEVAADAAAGGVDAGETITPAGKLVFYGGRKFDEAIIDKVKVLDESFGLSVSGGHRTVERNKEVGGSPRSYHLQGRAVDLVGSAKAMEEGAKWARANGAREVLIHNAGTGTHLHVAW